MTSPACVREHSTMRSLAVSSALPMCAGRLFGGAMLFVGDDWAEDHHDVEIVDDTVGALARRRLSNGLDGITRCRPPGR
jgi:hypothetical protein